MIAPRLAAPAPIAARLLAGDPAFLAERDRHASLGEAERGRGTDDAAAACAAVLADYPGHCSAARALAEAYFSPARALRGLLEDVEVAP